MAEIVAESWLEWGLGAEGGVASTAPEANTLAAHDAVPTNSRKAQQKVGKSVDKGRHAAHTALPEQLPETARPPGPDDPLGGGETKAFAKARSRSLQRAGSTACLRARPTDSLRVISAAEFVGIGRRFIGIGEHVAMRCPCCDAVDVDTRHACICPSAADEPAPTTSPRDLPHVEAARNSTPSGERRTVHCRHEPADGHRHQKRSSGRSEQRVQREVHPAGRHSCRPSSAGTPAKRQR